MKVEGAAVLGQGQAGGADREEPGGALCGCLVGRNTLFIVVVLGVGEVAAGEAVPSQGVEGVATLVDVVAAPVVELPWPAPMPLSCKGLMKIDIPEARLKDAKDIFELLRMRARIGIALKAILGDQSNWYSIQDEIIAFGCGCNERTSRRV